MILSPGRVHTPTWAILPIKTIQSAKQRLRAVLTAAERQALFREMLSDVLAAICRANLLDGLAIVTCDDSAMELCRKHGARLFVTGADHGLSAAVDTAAKTLSQEGISSIVTIPGDVPLVTAHEIDTVCASLGDAPAMTIVPDRAGIGSNSIACSPPCAIPFKFGDASLAKHLASAREKKVTSLVLRLPGLGLDIDNRADLVALLRRDTTTATQRYLFESGIAAQVLCSDVRSGEISVAVAEDCR